jgi:hypothetical protein
MTLTDGLAGRYVRIIAIITLLVGLGDAAQLLGIGSGAVSPIAILGPAGFAYLAVFCLSRLFAAVGLWIGASWGGVLLIGATGVELLLFLTGNRDIHMDAVGFGVRLLLVASILILFILVLRQRRTQD